jgi:hypothetical protein
MRILSGPAIVVAVLMLTGCAGMSEQACLATDWLSVGFEDGVNGRSVGSIASYRQSCSRHGVTPDLEQYRAGHSEGVETYCRVGNGFEVGRRGSRYAGVCPADLEPGFLEAYAEGRELYELEAALRSVENQIAARHRRTEELSREIAAAGAAIIADETPTERRAELLLNIAAMAEEQGTLGEEIQALEAERALRESDLYSYRQTLAFAP